MPSSHQEMEMRCVVVVVTTYVQIAIAEAGRVCNKYNTVRADKHGV